jgi:hypothetical protein
VDADEIGRLIGDLENRVERLRSLYEQYFMGIERLEPLTARKDVDRRLWALRREQIRNTGLRFKLETTVQRYNTYQQYWQRIVREIEQGTYQRDLGRAAQRFGDNAVTGFARRRQKMFENAVSKKAERDGLRRTGQGSPGETAEVEEAPPSSNEKLDVTFDDADPASTRVPVPNAAPKPGPPAPPPVPRPAAPITLSFAPRAPLPPPAPPPRPAMASSPGAPAPQPPPVPPPRPPMASSPEQKPAPVISPAKPATPAVSPAAVRAAASSAVLNEENSLSPIRMRQIYGQFVEAKRKANESTASVTYEKIAANLESAAKELRAKHKARSVDFEVVMKNGKPVLKPVVKG